MEPQTSLEIKISEISKFLDENKPLVTRVVTYQESVFSKVHFITSCLKPNEAVMILDDGLGVSFIKRDKDGKPEIETIDDYDKAAPKGLHLNFQLAIDFARRHEIRFLLIKDPISLNDDNKQPIPMKIINSHLENIYISSGDTELPQIVIVDRGYKMDKLDGRIMVFELPDLSDDEKQELLFDTGERVILKNGSQTVKCLSPITSEALYNNFSEHSRNGLEEFSKQNMKSDFFMLLNDLPTMDEVAGLSGVKEYIKDHKNIFKNLKQAKENNVIPPKGILLTGIQGCGKSWIAKAIAKELDLPIFEFNLSCVLGKLVGASESNMRIALKKIETLAPCIILMDEIDKQLGGVASSSKSDGGTLLRVVGMLLTFLQESKANVFLIGTSNNFDALPPEFVSRMDTLFFFDLPSQEERKESIKMKVNNPSLEIDYIRLAEINNLTHREIDKGVQYAKVLAFNRHIDKNVPYTLDTEDLFSALNSMTKLSDSRAKELAELRERLKDIAKDASKGYKIPESKPTSKFKLLKINRKEGQDD